MSETVALTSFQNQQAPLQTLETLETLQTSQNQQSPAFPGETVEQSAFPIEITAKAIDMIRSALEETKGEDGEFLRVGVKGGGCSGFQYSLNFTSEVDDEDIMLIVEGTKIVTDAFSASYLKGTELDYVESLQGNGFKFNNPTAKRTCGCGSSFSA